MEKMEYTPYKRVYKITPISNITIGIKNVESVLVYATLGIFQINIVSMIITYIINRILNHYIVKQLGGTTGDTYGFVVEVTEVLLLLIYIIILSVLSASVASNTTMF